MAFLEEYTLLDELGQGGYATVYKVRHNDLGYIRAIRVLNAIIAHGETDKTYQKFLEECRLLLRLGNGNHPNIVHIYQPLLKAQRAIVEMDFVDGKDLYHYLEEKHSFVEIKDVLRLLSDIGSALAYCHEDIYRFCMDREEDGLHDDPNDGCKVLIDNKTKQRLINKYRVIHNDIHSGNIIRREDGSYVLLDFGLAIEGDSVVRSSRRKNGAPEFKAPEKWDNESILTTQSDIYSFGVVLYEYLAGRVPFLFDKKNSNPAEAEYLLSKAHKEQQPASIFELRKTAFEYSHPGEIYEKDYPEWLEVLIMKCLAKSTKDRFKDGKELYSFVLEHINHETNSQIDDLKKEIESLQNKIISLENATPVPSKEVDKLVTDLQEQLKDVLLSKNNLEQKIKKIQSENASLKKQLRLYEEDNTERSKINSLESRLKEAERELQDTTNRLSNLTKENKVLQEDNTKLRKTRKVLLITLSIILLLLGLCISFLTVFLEESTTDEPLQLTTEEPLQPTTDEPLQPVTDIDGNEYKTVKLGNQVWMAENLRTTRYADGTPIPLGTEASYDVAYRYYPDDNSANVSDYGYLYNWAAVMNGSASSETNPSGVQGICPDGWHVPSDAEWTELENYVSSQSQYVCGSSTSKIAKALASETGWDPDDEECDVGNNPSANNATGFSARPAGCYYGYYGNFGTNAYFWSATQFDSDYAYGRNLGYTTASVYRSNYYKYDGYSVRCVRN